LGGKWLVHFPQAACPGFVYTVYLPGSDYGGWTGNIGIVRAAADAFSQASDESMGRGRTPEWWIYGIILAVKPLREFLELSLLIPIYYLFLGAIASLLPR